MHLHIEDRQENSSACQPWAATILSQPALSHFNSWVRKKASSWLRILTGQMATVSWLLAGHMNGSGAVYNLQALFHVGLAETTSVLVFRTFWLLQCYWIPKSEQKIKSINLKKSSLNQCLTYFFTYFPVHVFVLLVGFCLVLVLGLLLLLLLGLFLWKKPAISNISNIYYCRSLYTCSTETCNSLLYKCTKHRFPKPVPCLLGNTGCKELTSLVICCMYELPSQLEEFWFSVQNLPLTSSSYRWGRLFFCIWSHESYNFNGYHWNI